MACIYTCTCMTWLATYLHQVRGSLGAAHLPSLPARAHETKRTSCAQSAKRLSRCSKSVWCAAPASVFIMREILAYSAATVKHLLAGRVPKSGSSRLAGRGAANGAAAAGGAVTAAADGAAATAAAPIRRVCALRCLAASPRGAEGAVAGMC